MAETDRKTSWLKIIVAALAVFFFLLWLVNLKNVWQLSGDGAAASDSGLTWLNLRNDLERTMASARGQLNELKNQREAQEQDGRNFLLGLLDSARQKIDVATSSPVATATPIIATPVASSSPTVRNNNCPQWIDCMPGPDRRGPCQVPAGCEGITQIAY